MAIDLQQIASTRTGVAPSQAAPGEGVVSQELLQDLKQRLGDVGLKEIFDYMALQSSRLQELQQRPAIKAASAELPPPNDAMFPSSTDVEVSQAELGSLQQEAERLMAVASTDGDQAFSEFTQTADSIIKDLQERYGQTPGFFDTMLSGEIQRGSAETERKWREVLMKMASSKHFDAGTFLVALGQYRLETTGVVKGLQSALTQWAAQKEDYQRTLAQFDLGEGNVPAPHELFEMQRVQSEYMTDSQSTLQMIQMMRQSMDQIENMTKSLVSAVHDVGRAIIQNIR